MLSAIVLGALCSLLCAVAPNYAALIALRALLGLCLAGLPAVASAWLAEEMDARALGQAVGLIIAGNAAGGMSSRLVCGLLADLVGWRVAFAGLGALGAIAAFEFWRSLPPSRRHRPRPLHPRHALADLRSVFGERGLLPLFGARAAADGQLRELLQLPRLPPGAGAVRAVARDASARCSCCTWWACSRRPGPAGRPTALGSSRMLGAMLALCAAGLALTLSTALPVIIVGVALFTFGFFAAHSVASSWVGRLARRSKALASAVYLTAYYLGASSMGWLGGHAWQAGAWPGVLGFLACCGWAAWPSRCAWRGCRRSRAGARPRPTLVAISQF